MCTEMQLQDLGNDPNEQQQKKYRQIARNNLKKKIKDFIISPFIYMRVAMTAKIRINIAINDKTMTNATAGNNHSDNNDKIFQHA